MAPFGFSSARTALETSPASRLNVDASLPGTDDVSAAASKFQTDWSHVRSLVPEPALLAIAPAVLVGLLRRR